MTRRFRFISLFLFLAFLAAFYLLSPQILLALGTALVTDQPPQKSDAILVLAGDSVGQRILKGADLAQQGFAPLVYVSGPGGFYGRSEDQLAIAFATESGHPPDRFVGLPNRAESTSDEARLLLPILRSRGVKRLLLVTSNYHTARASRTFRRTDPQMQIITVAANDRMFPPQSWWRNRQGQKTLFFEVSKTLADYVGL